MFNNKGETLIETLVAVLILSLVIVGFSNVISTTAKLNYSVKTKRYTLNNTENTINPIENQENWSVKIDNRPYKVTVYYDKASDLYYYESKS